MLSNKANSCLVLLLINCKKRVSRWALKKNWCEDFQTCYYLTRFGNAQRWYCSRHRQRPLPASFLGLLNSTFTCSICGHTSTSWIGMFGIVCPPKSVLMMSHRSDDSPSVMICIMWCAAQFCFCFCFCWCCIEYVLFQRLWFIVTARH